MKTGKSAFDYQAKLRWSKRVHVQRYVRLVKRMARMGPSEISQRLRLKLRRHSKRGALYLHRRKDPHEATGRKFLQSLGASVREELLKTFQERFFFAPPQQQSIVDAISQHIPSSIEQTILRAENIQRNGIEVLGQKLQLKAGKTDWHADPETCIRAWPDGLLTEDEAINNSSADVKYVWEVNRHQFLTILGRAFWLTGQSHYARQACDLIDDWITGNPAGQGVNWCSHLEVAMRSISWLWTMSYLLAWPDLDEDFLKRWLQSIAYHHHHLSHNLSVFTDPTNHLIGEATALWMLSVCLPDLPNAKNQADRARKILIQELERQVTADGVNKEHASSYHRFVLDFYLQILILSRQLGESLPPSSEKRIEAMLDFAAALAGRHGRAPMTGDSDDARGVPLPELVGWDFRDVLSTGAVLFERPEWKKQAGHLAEATIWLMGIDAVEAFDRLTGKSEADRSRVFTPGGYSFFDSSSPDHEAELIFGVGPLGLWPNAAHGHADALSILIRLDGDFLLTDPGTGAYFGSRQIRDAFRCTTAHNTVTVDGLDQADIYGTFKWVNPMNVRLIESHIGEAFSMVTGMHDGYQRLRKPITHYRTVLSVGTEEWVIIDYLEGKGEHLFTRNFNFPPAVILERDSGQSAACIARDSGAGLKFSFPETANTRQSLAHTDDEGIWSDRYGHWQPAPHLAINTHGAPPLTLFTFISPVFDQTQTGDCHNQPVFTLSTLSDGETVICRRQNNQSDNCVTDTIVINRNGHPFTLPGGIKSDAEFLFIRQLSDNSIQKAFFAGKSRYLAGPNGQLTNNEHKRFVSYTSSESVEE